MPYPACGYGSMVVMSLEQYSVLTENVEVKLDKADRAAAEDLRRYTSDEVFTRLRKRIGGYREA